MDLSWAAAIFIPTIITPAVLFYFIFRLIVPKSKAPPQNDLTSILLFSLITTFINVCLIGYLSDLIVRPYLDLSSKPDVYNLFMQLVGWANYQPFRPSLLLSKLFSVSLLETNIFGIFLDLHLRPIIICTMVWALSTLVKWFKLVVDKFFYGRLPSNLLRAAIDFSMEKFKKYFFSYWNYVLDFDPNLEILMLDIQVSNGDLHSGIFVDWTPDDSLSNDTVGSIGIRNIFKYNGKEDLSDNENGDEKKALDHFERPRSRRRWRLIVNNGTMYFPFHTIRTIHIWKIKKGTTFTIWDTDSNTNERLRWYLLLAADRPDFIKKIYIKAKVKTAGDHLTYLSNIENLLSEDRFEKILDKIEITILHNKPPKEPDSENKKNKDNQAS